MTEIIRQVSVCSWCPCEQSTHSSYMLHVCAHPCKIPTCNWLLMAEFPNACKGVLLDTSASFCCKRGTFSHTNTWRWLTTFAAGDFCFVLFYQCFVVWWVCLITHLHARNEFNQWNFPDLVLFDTTKQHCITKKKMVNQGKKAEAMACYGSLLKQGCHGS